MQPDSLLCALAERGNEDAFGVLHTRYRQQVFAFVYHLLGRPGSVDDAEDLTQEIMQKAYANLNTRRSGGSFKAWLFRIARNHTFDHIRARKPASVSLDDADIGIEPSNVVSLHSQVEHREEVSWLLGALVALPERQRQALVMRELGGQSVDEIAECLETTPESAKQLIKRGRASVTQAADQSGVRSKKLGRELAAAAPITAIAWLGAGKASAAAGGVGAAVAGAGAAGGASAGGVAAGVGGVAAVSGKVAATVLAVAAIGAGGAVVGEQAITSDQPAADKTAGENGPAVPAQSLVVGSRAAEQAVANKQAANARRDRARQRAAARKKAKAKAKARAERAKRAEGNSGKSTTRGNKGGNSNSTSAGNGKSSGGSGNSKSTTTPGQGSGNSSSGSNGSSGGSANGGGSNSSGGGNGKGKPTE